jgi:anaerobic magnesium-protoporphyrin IX monomethyl ester cyclase
VSFLRRLMKRKRRVALVTSPSSFPTAYVRSNTYPFSMVPVVMATPLIPLGPAYIAASLEQAGYDVKVVDCTFIDQNKFDPWRVRDAVLSLGPDAIGLSALTWTIPSAYQLAEAIKEDSPETPVILGGPHVSALPRRTLRECGAIDAAILGEGERTFPDFLGHLFSKGMGPEMENLSGVAYRHGGEAAGDTEPVYVEDLDALPSPARHLFPLSEYVKWSKNFEARRTPVASMITSRGCPHRCTFCTRVNNGVRHRARSPGSVVGEMEELKEMGFNEVQIVDDNFTHDRGRVHEICRLIRERGLDLTFQLANGMRVDHVTQELMEAMYDVGFYSIHFGVESGDDRVLRDIQKDITVDQVREAVRITRDIGYELNLFFVIGLPGSTVESEEKTLALMEELGLPVTYSVCTPYPGSPLWEQMGDKMDEVTWDRFDEGDVADPLYLPDGLTLDELQEVVDRARALQKSASERT